MAEFVEGGLVLGVSMQHPNGGPALSLRLAPERATAAAGFDYFAIGVPTKEDIERLARRLTDLGDEHAGVQFASIGWILPLTHDPDGHEVRFYTTERHTAPDDPAIARIDDAIATAKRREAAYLSATPK